MMKLFPLSLLILFLSANVSFNTAQADFRQFNTRPLYSNQYDPQRDPFADGKAAIELATKTQRRILIEVGGDWCKWCHILDKFIKSDPLIEQALHKTFVVLKVNVSDENSNEKFLASFPKTLGYPHMYVTESDGRVVHSQDTAEFLVNLKYSKLKFMAFLDKWKIKSVNKVVNK